MIKQARQSKKIALALLATTLLPMAANSYELPAVATVGFAHFFEQKPKFLPVHEAFQVVPSVERQQIRLAFTITPKHYIYKDRLSLQLPEGVTSGQWQFDIPSVMVDDPIFGQVAVFEQNVVATITLNNQTAAPINDTITVTWQGCAKAGLCYPPENLAIKLDLPTNQTTQASHQALNSALTISADPSDSLQDTLPALNDLVDGSSTSEHLLDGQFFGGKTQTIPSQTARYSLNHSTNNRTIDVFGLLDKPFMAVLLLFLAGVVLAFSACVYPMIPIVANIVAKSHSPSAARGFWLTLAYGLGVATSYGILGALVAWFGQSLGIIGWLQNPWVLYGFALLFVVLACHMMGLWHLSLPSFIKKRLAQGSQAADHYLGSTGGSFVVGALSALVVSPCVSAPLAGALLAVSMRGDAALGFVALFALGLGLSLPLVVMGTVQGKWMPKAGAWMDGVKFFGGLMLLLVALLLVSRVLFGASLLLLWALWFGLFGLFLWRLKRLVFQAVALMSLAWSLCLMVGAAQGNYDPWQPLKRSETEQSGAINDLRVTTLSELDAILASHPKVLVDVSADWCIECRIMERTLFTNRPWAMTDWQLVRLDVTDTNADSRAILQRYQLFGPPALLYYHKGQLQNVQLGEVKRAEFEQALAAF